jgi:transcriptional regulator with XRE-family HTH domain
VKKSPRQRFDRMMARAFGERLHRYREDRGLSQRQLSTLAGVDPVQISRYERGLGLPAADSLIALAKALHLSLDTLLLGKADRKGDDLPIKNVLLLDRLQQLDKLDRRNQETVIEVIDSVLTRSEVESAAESRKRHTA